MKILDYTLKILLFFLEWESAWKLAHTCLKKNISMFREENTPFLGFGPLPD